MRFPNSMVDRITPQTTDDDRHEVQQRFGLDDAWPVVGEPFAQGLLEHAFTAGRPPYEHAGVQVVDDAEPHELMKPRLLNVSHRALCYFAYLDGCTRGYMNEQGSPTLSRPDLEGYRATLIERFSNPWCARRSRACARAPATGSPKWLLPVVRRSSATRASSPRPTPSRSCGQVPNRAWSRAKRASTVSTHVARGRRTEGGADASMARHPRLRHAGCCD